MGGRKIAHGEMNFTSMHQDQKRLAIYNICFARLKKYSRLMQEQQSEPLLDKAYKDIPNQWAFVSFAKSFILIDG